MALDIEDRYEIEQLLHRYCHNADYSTPDAMRSIFTEDAVFELGAMNVRCEGIDAILAFFHNARGSMPPSQHVINNLVLEGDGDSAQSSCYMQLLSTVDAKVQIAMNGRYMDTLRRTPAGWRLAQRIITN